MTSTFNALQLPLLASGLSWKVLYKPAAVSLVVLPNGDFDHDGAVDAADLARWSANVGPSTLGDADGDNDTDGADFLAWQRQINGPAASPATAAVPEPATLALLRVTLAAACGFARPARRRCPSL